MTRLTKSERLALILLLLLALAIAMNRYRKVKHAGESNREALPVAPADVHSGR